MRVLPATQLFYTQLEEGTRRWLGYTERKDQCCFPPVARVARSPISLLKLPYSTKSPDIWDRTYNSTKHKVWTKWQTTYFSTKRKVWTKWQYTLVLSADTRTRNIGTYLSTATFPAYMYRWSSMRQRQSRPDAVDWTAIGRSLLPELVSNYTLIKVAIWQIKENDKDNNNNNEFSIHRPASCYAAGKNVK